MENSFHCWVKNWKVKTEWENIWLSTRLVLKMWLSITSEGNGNFSEFEFRVSVFTLSVGKQKRQVRWAQGNPPEQPTTPGSSSLTPAHGENLLGAKQRPQHVWDTQGHWAGDQFCHSGLALLTFPGIIRTISES